MIGSQIIRVLLIEDDEDDYILTRSHLMQIEYTRYELDWVNNFEDGLERVLAHQHQVCLVDFRLGEHTGLDLLRASSDDAERMPIIMLTGQSDRAIDIEAMNSGAADYLIKNQINPSMLERSIRYAMEHERMKRELRAMSLFDDLTGLHNRRGFTTLAEHELKIAQRIKHDLILFFADLDGLKTINDKQGHAIGDEAIRLAAEVLKKTFRDSDILARLGGDEFVIVTTGARVDDPGAIIDRLQRNVNTENAATKRSYRLAMSVGAVRYDPVSGAKLHDLLAEADKMMYAKKQARKSSIA